MEKEKESLLLARYLGREAASLASLHVERPDELGALREAFILFADIRHFSCLAERVSLAELKRFLGGFMGHFAAAIERGGGMVNKFAGDGALALFFAGGAQEPLATALQVRAHFLAQASSWPSRITTGAERLDLALGLHFGEFFFGNIGSQGRYDLTAIGAAVNIACRLAGDAPGGGVFCTAPVQLRLGDCAGIALKPLGTRKLRGMSPCLPLFEALAPDNKEGRLF